MICPGTVKLLKKMFRNFYKYVLVPVSRMAKPVFSSREPQRRGIIKSSATKVCALQRMGRSRFENLSAHERSCLLSCQHQGGHCTCRIAAREANPNGDANARASISRIVMLAEALFEVVDSLPLKIFSKFKRKPCENNAQKFLKKLMFLNFYDGILLFVPLMAKPVFPCRESQRRGIVQSSNTKNVQPNDTILIALLWLPSFGVAKYGFSLHGTFLPKDVQRKTAQRQNINFSLKDISPELRKDMEEHWPDVSCFGDVIKYERFWCYQWQAHGVYTGMSIVDYFKKVIERVKKLPPTLGLEPGEAIQINCALKKLKSAVHVRCHIVSNRIRGYICADDMRHYSIRILDEVRIASNKQFSVQDHWNNVMSTEQIILPNYPVHRYKSLATRKLILYMPQQPNHMNHVDQEVVKNKTREKIYLENKEVVSFMVVENEKKREKYGILVIPAHQQFNPNHKVFSHFKRVERHLTKILSRLDRNGAFGLGSRKLQET